MKLNDIVLAINGVPVENVPMFSTAMLSLPGGQKVKLDLLRGNEKLSLSVGAVEESHAADRLADMIDPEKNRIRQLGIIGIAIDKQTESLFPGLRGPYGGDRRRAFSVIRGEPDGIAGRRCHPRGQRHRGDEHRRAARDHREVQARRPGGAVH